MFPHRLLATLAISALASAAAAQQSSKDAVSTFRRKLSLPSNSELLCAHVDGSSRLGGVGRLSYVYVVSANDTSARGQSWELVLVDETYSQLQLGGLVSRSSCRWPSLDYRPRGESWTPANNCRRAVLKPLNSRRLGLAFVVSERVSDGRIRLAVLDATSCTLDEKAELPRREEHPERFPDLDESLWMLARSGRDASTVMEVLFSAQEWRGWGPRCTGAAAGLCTYSTDAVGPGHLGMPKVLDLGAVDSATISGLHLLPVRSGATASLGEGYLVLLETEGELVIRAFDSEGELASEVKEPKPQGSLQLVVQATSDEDYERADGLGPLLRYCWLTDGARAECRARGPGLDPRSNLSLVLGYENSDEGSLLDMRPFTGDAENFLLLTRGGVDGDRDELQEAPYYLRELSKKSGKSSEWESSLPLEIVLSYGAGKPFLGRGDGVSYCSIGLGLEAGGRALGVEIRCMPLNYLICPD